MSAEAILRIWSVRYAISVTVLLSLVVASTPAGAGVIIRVHRASQTLSVFVDGVWYATWIVSTGRRGYRTPRGTFRPSRLERVWYSSKYYDSPMPNSIFFAGGYAIHGTTEIRNLGRRVSHGCIRLHPAHAKELFDLVRSHGRGATRIMISLRTI
jgi:lipoprotein-anchoring transpeptidase ErfK/SrfK